MNYLAHLFLSGDSDEIKIGNFIGDAVKGKQYLHFSEGIQRGILLHRAIDSFTDQHIITKQCSQRFRDSYARYSGIVTDVVFDHFLAANFERYSVIGLNNFIGDIHKLLLSRFFILPNEIKSILPFFIQHKRLESYATLEGLEQTLEIMGRNTSMPRNSHLVIKVIRDNYDNIKSEFESFFPDLISFVETKGIVISYQR